MRVLTKISVTKFDVGHDQDFFLQNSVVGHLHICIVQQAGKKKNFPLTEDNRWKECKDERYKMQNWNAF